MSIAVMRQCTLIETGAKNIADKELYYSNLFFGNLMFTQDDGMENCRFENLNWKSIYV